MKLIKGAVYKSKYSHDIRVKVLNIAWENDRYIKAKLFITYANGSLKNHPIEKCKYYKLTKDYIAHWEIDYQH